MNDVLAKITNLGYEIFGVFLPGIVGNIFLFLVWKALGETVPYWTTGVIPELTLTTVRQIVDSLNVGSGIGAALTLGFFWYFVGHLFVWAGRFGKPDNEVAKKSWLRFYRSLTFRIPKLKESFDKELTPIFDVVRKAFSLPGTDLEWRQFYPVAKVVVADKVGHSLIATYQNKYTFHRAMTVAGAILFWVVLVLAIVLLVAHALVPGAPQPCWIGLGMLSVGALILVWNFSSSYLYNWTMFGNSIITESYSLILEREHGNAATK